MRTTLAIDESLLEEVKTLSGAKTKKEAVEKALGDYVARKKAMSLLDMEGKMDLSYTRNELLDRRKKDVPHR